MSAKVGEKVTDYVPGHENAFIYGMHIVYITAAVICLIGAFITALRLFSRRKETLGYGVNPYIPTLFRMNSMK